MQLHNTIIYLIGIPAVGKYTVAKEIGRLTGAKVVDNQLINLPVFSVMGYDGTATFPFPQGAWAHIETIRRAVFAAIRECCPLDDSFVLTNVLDAHAPRDKALFRRIERLAQQRNAGFFPVWLTCDAERLRQHKNTPERRARRKDSDVSTIAWWLQVFEVLRVPHPNALTLDTSCCGPDQTAQRIVEHVQGTEHSGRAATQSATRDGA
jgi:hypothetical protein